VVAEIGFKVDCQSNKGALFPKFTQTDSQRPQNNDLSSQVAPHVPLGRLTPQTIRVNYCFVTFVSLTSLAKNLYILYFCALL